MNSGMKKSLAAPIKQMTGCVSGTEDPKRDGNKKKPVRRKSAFRMSSLFRRKSVVRRKSAPTQKIPDHWLRVYEAEFQRERKLSEARVAKRKAERAVGRSCYFRSQHCLRRTSLQNARRPPAIQQQQYLRSTSNARRPAGKAADSSLFGAFEGLSLDGLTGGSQAEDQCKVM